MPFAYSLYSSSGPHDKTPNNSFLYLLKISLDFGVTLYTVNTLFVPFWSLHIGIRHKYGYVPLKPSRKVTMSSYTLLDAAS